MKRRYQYIILSAIIVFSGWYFYTHSEMFQQIKGVSSSSLVLLILIVSMSHIINGYKFRCLMQIFSVNLSFKEWFGISVCNTMFNYYLPARGGTAIRAYYLKTKHQFNYSRYTTLIAGSSIITFMLSAGLGLGLTLLYGAVHGIMSEKLIVLFSCLLVLTMVLNIVFSFSLSLAKKLRNERLRRILENSKEGFGFFQKNWQLALRFSILLLTSIFISGARLFVCFSSIDLDVVPLQMLIISSLTTFSMVLSLTPANLGVREGIISFAAHLFGIPADRAVLAALIGRGAVVVVTFLFGLIFSRILLSDMKLVEQNIEN